MMGEAAIPGAPTFGEWQRGKSASRGRGLKRVLKGLRTLFASKSDYLENKFLDHALSDGAFAEPANVYMALCTAVPTDASTGATLTEATYTGYARQEILATDLSAAASGSKTNSAAITFAACTAGTSTIIGFAIVDSATTGAGNVLYWGTTTSKVIDTTSTPGTVAIGGLVVTED